jgi:DNA adenine methylase
LAKTVIARIPAHTCYVEPFCGAAWVLFRKIESKVEVLNDINREVVTLYRCLQWHLEEFMRYFKWVLVSRDEFDRLKKADPDTLTDIQRAAGFYYLLQAGFGGRVVNPSFGYGVMQGSKLNLLRIEEYLSAAHLRLARVYVECLPYAEVISRYDSQDTFFYVDPPYWDCEHHYGRDIFSRDDFACLAEQLAGIKGRFLLSINDRPEIRVIFKAFVFEEVRLIYSSGKKQNTDADELLVWNR